ncbi:Uu.00g121030.m01.CDS01, partial [Anthostomella pinea]
MGIVLEVPRRTSSSWLGPRNYVGVDMAWHEMRLLLAELMFNFDIKSDVGPDWRGQNVYVGLLYWRPSCEKSVSRVRWPILIVKGTAATLVIGKHPGFRETSHRFYRRGMSGRSLASWR